MPLALNSLPIARSSCPQPARVPAEARRSRRREAAARARRRAAAGPGPSCQRRRRAEHEQAGRAAQRRRAAGRTAPRPAADALTPDPAARPTRTAATARSPSASRPADGRSPFADADIARIRRCHAPTRAAADSAQAQAKCPTALGRDRRLPRRDPRRHPAPRRPRRGPSGSNSTTSRTGPAARLRPRRWRGPRRTRHVPRRARARSCKPGSTKAGQEIDDLCDQYGRDYDPELRKRGDHLLDAIRGRMTREAKVKLLRDLGVPEPAILDFLANELHRTINTRNGPRDSNEVRVNAARQLLGIKLAKDGLPPRRPSAGAARTRRRGAEPLARRPESARASHADPSPRARSTPRPRSARLLDRVRSMRLRLASLLVTAIPCSSRPPGPAPTTTGRASRPARSCWTRATRWPTRAKPTEAVIRYKRAFEQLLPGLRKIPFKHEVKRDVTKREDLKAMLLKEIDEDMTPAEFRANELAMKAFGLVPRDFDLKDVAGPGLLRGDRRLLRPQDQDHAPDRGARGEGEEAARRSSNGSWARPAGSTRTRTRRSSPTS